VGSSGTSWEGGNIESGPNDVAPGDFLHGQDLDPNIVSFFEGQGVNPLLSVNTDWLEVGHVDEVVSFAPDGEHVIVADPEVCWALLVHANDVNSNAIMREGFIPNDESYPDDDDPDSDGQKVSWVLNSYPGPDEVLLRDYNLVKNNPDYVMGPNNLPSIRNKLGLMSPESPPEPNEDDNTGTGALSKAGALVGFFPNTNKREYLITFNSSTDYKVEYRELPSGGWEWDPNDGYGSTSKNYVFPDSKCFIFSHWWSGTPDANDTFVFEADPDCNTIEMPVLFFKDDNGASAFTINHVNSLVDGGTVFTGDPNGPKVLNEPNEPNDILMNYAKRLFIKAGFSGVNDADSRYYHYGGNIHCGTNVQRVIPDYKWWEY